MVFSHLCLPSCALGGHSIHILSIPVISGLKSYAVVSSLRDLQCNNVWVGPGSRCDLCTTHQPSTEEIQYISESVNKHADIVGDPQKPYNNTTKGSDERAK